IQNDVLAALQAGNPDLFKDFTAGDVHVNAEVNKPEDGDDTNTDEYGEGISTVKADYTLKVTKMDAEQCKGFGWAYVSVVADKLSVDKQGDAIWPEDLEKAAHDFVLNYRLQGDMHQYEKATDETPVQKGRLIESMVFTVEKRKLGLVALDPDSGQPMSGWFVG